MITGQTVSINKYSKILPANHDRQKRLLYREKIWVAKTSIIRRLSAHNNLRCLIIKYIIQNDHIKLETEILLPLYHYRTLKRNNFNNLVFLLDCKHYSL